ncbi:MAG TPA: metallophosphoesterase family protein [Trebonia sp.]|jgi:predicted phosphodiesterase|nr:metallophosphoesterase family protein [Trebonia sp.]
MESVAVLSDIHGVLPALDAVLAEPAVQAADRIVLTGDIAAGPQPGEVLDRLIGLGDRVTWVRGNADRELVELARGDVDDVGDPIAHWAARQLGPDHRDRLASLPLSVLLDVGGFGPVLFCHATPRDDAEVVVVDSRLERWAEVLAELPGEVMTVVCGHTHMPFARLANRRQIVNPGSVGMPYGRAGAHWALLSGGTVELRRTGYDVPAACASVCAQSAYPDIAEWTDYFLHSRASDADALAVMAPRDGRLPAGRRRRRVSSAGRRTRPAARPAAGPRGPSGSAPSPAPGTRPRPCRWRHRPTGPPAPLNRHAVVVIGNAPSPGARLPPHESTPASAQPASSGAGEPPARATA